MSKQNIYDKIEAQADKVVDRLIELTDSKNPTVALGACRSLMERIAPPLRGVGLLEVAHLDYTQKNHTKRLLNEYYEDLGDWGKVKEADIDRLIAERKLEKPD